MQTFLDGLRWLVSGSHWTGYDGIPVRVFETLEIFGVAIAVAVAIALPVGLYVGHTRRGAFVSVSVANVGRSIPSFGILAIAYLIVLEVAPSFAFGFLPAAVALVLLGIPPVLTNTYVGIQGIDADTVEAARGMGLSERDVLLRLEVPLAVPLIMAGVRTSAVTVMATAPLAALIGGGTLGRFVVDGLAQSDEPKLIAGAILVALLAILTEVTFAWLERRLTPRTSSAAPRRGAAAATEPPMPYQGLVR
jgi:osmoprotectant transport system permease protein